MFCLTNHRLTVRVKYLLDAQNRGGFLKIIISESEMEARSQNFVLNKGRSSLCLYCVKYVSYTMRELYYAFCQY